MRPFLKLNTIPKSSRVISSFSESEFSFCESSSEDCDWIATIWSPGLSSDFSVFSSSDSSSLDDWHFEIIRGAATWGSWYASSGFVNKTIVLWGYQIFYISLPPRVRRWNVSHREAQFEIRLFSWNLTNFDKIWQNFSPTIQKIASTLKCIWRQ